MSKEKQIEEMAKTLCGEKEKRCENCDSYRSCEFWIEASILHNTGYRKQSEWISVDEKLPEESGEYIASTKSGLSMCLPYSAKYKMFNVYDGQDAAYAEKMAIKVTHWMPLPEPLKGE